MFVQVYRKWRSFCMGGRCVNSRNTFWAMSQELRWLRSGWNSNFYVCWRPKGWYPKWRRYYTCKSAYVELIFFRLLLLAHQITWDRFLYLYSFGIVKINGLKGPTTMSTLCGISNIHLWCASPSFPIVSQIFTHFLNQCMFRVQILTIGLLQIPCRS